MFEGQKEASVAGPGCGATANRPFKVRTGIQPKGDEMPSEGLESTGEGSDFCFRTVSPEQAGCL